ncbi:bifunctional Protein prenyltransferase [Babesia duncani]|uniref:Geranylgeranyl transferase type-2 subunit alpha n=1 Tax=Babesia duncani TaxID=323732 RepID=A0AAD9UNQ8_9APIC|nr:bifunctional Protein prenyltransferase [Babesia duncani]
MHGLRQSNFYTTPEEKEKYNDKLKKGYELLDKFVDFVKHIEHNDDISEDQTFAEGKTNGEWMFELSNAIIEFMPEFGLSWNYRKRFLINKLKLDKNDGITRLMDERKFSEGILRTSPKSYAIWHHRLWLITVFMNIGMDNLNDILTVEFMLCIKLFKHDARNFHCWGYLNFIRHYMKALKDQTFAKMSLDKLCWSEFEKLIFDNFSNYSAWHQRSYLSSSFTSVHEELELLKQAIFTDPNDQTLWYYHDWLLYHRNALKYHLVNAHYDQDSCIFTFHFNKCILLDGQSAAFQESTPNLDSIESRLHYKSIDGVWIAENGHPFADASLKACETPQYVWHFIPRENSNYLNCRIKFDFCFKDHDGVYSDFYYHLLNNKHFYPNDRQSVTNLQSSLLKVSYEFEMESYGLVDLSRTNITMWYNDNTNWQKSDKYAKPLHLKSSNEFVSLGYGVDDKVLQEQLDMVEELIELESNTKHLLLARIKLLKTLGMDCDFVSMYKQLAELDPPRESYYHDLEKQTRIRRALETSGNGIDLSNLGLDKLTYTAMCPRFYLKAINLGNNLINDRTLIDFCIPYMYYLDELDLSGNQISDTRMLFTLLGSCRIKRLDVSRNNLQPLTKEKWPKCSNVCEIDISDTPLSDSLITNAIEANAGQRHWDTLGQFKVIFSKGLKNGENVSTWIPTLQNKDSVRVKLLLI